MNVFNKKKWDLNIFYKFLISYVIGLTIYISFCFILDIFEFYNLFTGYLSFVIFDFFFIIYLIRRNVINREKISKLKSLILINLSKKRNETIIFLIILCFAIIIQIWVQWIIITKEYAIPSKDTYVWLGQSWYLLEKGKLWREHLTIQYPKGYVFFLAAPELIYPDYRFAYFYMKFSGIPLFSFYIFTFSIILKDIFKKNIMVFLGLSFILISGHLFSRFITSVSSGICALLIVISLIILYNKSPFFLTGFILISTFLFNSLFALLYCIILLLLLLIKAINLKTKLSIFFKEYIVLTLLIVVALIIPYIIHSLIVQNLNISDYVILFNEAFGVSLVPSHVFIRTSKFDLLLIDMNNILKDMFPNNDFISAFLDIEKRILSFFFIIAIVSLFFSTEKYFKKRYCDFINFCKISVLIIVAFYIIEIFFIRSSNEILSNSDWFKFRAVEALAGPAILIVCFIIEISIEKAKLLTHFFINHSTKYRGIIANSRFSKLVRIESVLITMILISVISATFYNRSVYYSYYFEQDQIDTIFFIKSNIPDDSKILVSDFGNGPNCLYNLLSTYKVYKWDFEFSKNTFNDTLDYIREKNIKYILLDYTMINSTEKRYFTNSSYFEEMYINEFNIVFDIDI